MKEEKKQEEVSVFGVVFALVFMAIGMTMCSTCDVPDSNQSNEYWKNVSTEKKLRESGMDDAADRMKKYRQEELYK